MSLTNTVQCASVTNKVQCVSLPNTVQCVSLVQLLQRLVTLLGGVDRGLSLNVDYSIFALLVYNLQPKFEENLHLHQKVKIYNLLQKFIKIYNFQINAFLPLLTFNQAILLIYRGKMPYIRNMSVPIESYQHNKNMPQRNVYIQYTFNKLSNV